MSDHQPPGADDGHETVPSTEARKPYQRPQILSRERLEAMAAVCSGGGAKAVSNQACSVLSS